MQLQRGFVPSFWAARINKRCFIKTSLPAPNQFSHFIISLTTKNNIAIRLQDAQRCGQEISQNDMIDHLK